jgi:hypothetical protein
MSVLRLWSRIVYPATECRNFISDDFIFFSLIGLLPSFHLQTDHIKTQLISQEDLYAFSHCENFKSYILIIF